MSSSEAASRASVQSLQSPAPSGQQRIRRGDREGNSRKPLYCHKRPRQTFFSAEVITTPPQRVEADGAHPHTATQLSPCAFKMLVSWDAHKRLGITDL
jgi:hypothetical protein